VAVLFRSSTLPSAPSVVLKDVPIHLMLPPDQKLSEASLVSSDRFYVSRCLSTGVGGSSPLHHGFRGGPSKWLQPLLAGVWLRTLLSLPPPFCRVSSGPVALFNVRPWGDGLSFQLDFPLTSLRTLLPSIAAPGMALFRLTSRLRQVRPGLLPLWPIAPPWAKFCVLAFGLMP
jgi:hypothetical protein